jgi:hypothetical protein
MVMAREREVYMVMAREIDRKDKTMRTNILLLVLLLCNLSLSNMLMYMRYSSTEEVSIINKR